LSAIQKFILGVLGFKTMAAKSSKIYNFHPLITLPTGLISCSIFSIRLLYSQTTSAISMAVSKTISTTDLFFIGYDMQHNIPLRAGDLQLFDRTKN
jgi:hypothetical protein